MRKVTVRIPKVFILIVAFLFIAIIIKLSFVSLSSEVDGINLHNLASNRNTKTETIYAKRGNIYDNEGEVLASVVNSYKIIAYLDPKREKDYVVDKDATAKMLNEYLGIPYDEAMERLNKEGRYQVEFGTKGNNITESLKNKIEALDLPGIDFIQSQRRTYSTGSFASYIIGYAKKPNGNEDGEIIGELGIEAYYNKELSGTNGSTTYQTDAYGYTLPSAEVITEEAVNGDDIYLTLDSDIQWFTETMTNNLAQNYQMEWLIVTVMDAKTGAIVASSTVPNFDPNDREGLTIYMNPLVSYTYEPGSTMKTFSFASAIEEGIYNGDELYHSGQIKVADATIKDHNKGQGWGDISFNTGFTYSSNVAATIIARRLGVEKLTDYYKKLGFGSKTGIELSSEASGVVDFHYETELANAGFGQGISVTPIQMLQALSSLTNDGTTIKPYIVDKIVNAKGETVYKGERTEVAKVFSKETTDYMKDLMYKVVYEGMSSSKIWQPTKTTMIGKTGTAQIASKSGGYLNGAYDYVRSFAGIFPKEDPKYIIYVAAQQLNSSSAKPIAEELTKVVDNIVSYLGIENVNPNKDSKVVTMDNYISKEVSPVKDALTNSALKVYSIGTGKYIINQYPEKGTKALEGSKVFLISNNHDYVLEDLTGWSLNEVRTYANLIGLNLQTNGYGYVTSQSAPAGTAISDDLTLEVTLSE